jgi:hypothetical protein
MTRCSLWQRATLNLVPRDAARLLP